MKDDTGSTTEEETPDVEAHRHEASRHEPNRADVGAEPEDRHRNEGV